MDIELPHKCLYLCLYTYNYSNSLKQIILLFYSDPISFQNGKKESETYTAFSVAQGMKNFIKNYIHMKINIKLNL